MPSPLLDNSMSVFTVAFIVANNTEVANKRNSGTRITLHLKDESDQYLDDIALRALIEKYSEFAPFPIELQR